MVIIISYWLNLSLVQGIGKLSVVAASAAQSAANVVQAGTKEFTSKVFLGILIWISFVIVLQVDVLHWVPCPHSNLVLDIHIVYLYMIYTKCNV